jgi:hypothetical protein
MAVTEEVREMGDAETTLAIIKNELLESRMMRKYPVRFGGRRTEKDAAGCPSLPLHYGPVNELRH